MIIYRQAFDNGNPIYEIITKPSNHYSKMYEHFSNNELYKLLSLLEHDVDNMKLSY